MNRPIRLAAIAIFLIPLLLAWAPVGTGEARAASQTNAAATSITFPETGKTVSGKLLTYWQAHGGLAAQGYPITEQMQERSEIDGKTYALQYFERSVLELHPENRPPYDVLPSLLGVFRYRERYPNGAPGQKPNDSPDSIIFPETGKRLGGGFLNYWRENGGLTLYGYPISDEFVEKSDLDGKTYTVQYFERVVFEWHPENKPPYNILLSQLGTARYRARQATPVPPTPTPIPPRKFGIDGQGGLGEGIDTDLLKAQYDAGARVRLVHLGWDVLQPGGPDSWDGRVAQAFQDRINAFVAQGRDVQLVLDLGIHYAPGWAADVDPLVDQFGNTWNARNSMGGVNVYWSPNVRHYVAGYLDRVFRNLDFKGRLWLVRVGPYGGELLYPGRDNGGDGMSFWAFDPAAQSKSPVGGWRPGQASPSGEAERFYNWYVDNLADTFNFFLGEIRKHYQGLVAPVTPGMGVNEHTARRLVERNLVDNWVKTYGTGNYWQRLFADLPRGDKGVVNWCSSLGDASGDDNSPNWWEWSSAKQMSYLAQQNGREIYGENRGRNPFDASGGADERTTARWIFWAMQQFGYRGLMWVNQAQMNDPKYANLDQFRALVNQYR
jgi:hypothetical protein